jgi:rare lipoprotein A
MNWRLTGTMALAVILAACSSAPERKTTAPAQGPKMRPVTILPGGGGYLSGDGPGAEVPDNLDSLPDAVPRAEPLHKYANRPYVALGKTYTPVTELGKYKKRGIASWYGKKFHGQRTSTGEVYDMFGMTAAHTVLPVPSYARVTNLANGKSVIVRVNDRGPFMHERVIDLSYAAAHKLGIIGNGSEQVEVESLIPGAGAGQVAAAPAAEPAPAPAAVTAPVSVQVADLPLPDVPVVASIAAPIATPAAAPAATVASAPARAGYYLQLGAFKSGAGAESFLAHLKDEFGDSGQPLGSRTQDGITRVHAGPYASAEEARAASDKLKAKLGFKPLLRQYKD